MAQQNAEGVANLNAQIARITTSISNHEAQIGALTRVGQPVMDELSRLNALPDREAQVSQMGALFTAITPITYEVSRAFQALAQDYQSLRLAQTRLDGILKEEASRTALAVPDDLQLNKEAQTELLKKAIQSVKAEPLLTQDGKNVLLLIVSSWRAAEEWDLISSGSERVRFAWLLRSIELIRDNVASCFVNGVRDRVSGRAYC